MRAKEYSLSIEVNGHKIVTVLIGRHYELKHGHYMNDELILELVVALDGGTYPVDSTTDGINYYAADVIHGNETNPRKTFRIIWLIEGENLEILGVINAYRRRNRRP